MSSRSGLTIQNLRREDLPRLQVFTDRAIGKGYYSLQELEDIYERSHAVGRDGLEHMCSLVLRDGDEILGVRITYAPGKWDHGKGEGENHGLHVDRWPHPLSETGYFQSLFLADEVQGEGWGPKLSLTSIEQLKKLGARGVVCHSWKESPHNSSVRYLEKLGFAKIAEHPLYWQHVNYNCPRCGPPPCQCTAIEMYLDIVP